MTKIISILTILGMAFGVLFWADGRFAKCAETQANKQYIRQVEKSVNMLATGITRDTKQNRLWALEDRYKTRDPTKIQNESDRKEMRQLQIEVPALGKKIDDLNMP